MLGFPPFYFKTIRNCVIAFGSLFQDLTLVKYTNGTTTEQSRLTVPLYYEGKEGYVTRTLDNPRLAKPVEITLPRAGFELKTFRYAPERKLNTYNNINIPSGSGSALQQFQAVPWDLGFNLYFYVRNIEDGTQLVEQILPFFVPQYSLTINYVPELGISRSAPMILNNVSWDNQYEGDTTTTIREITWTLEFTLQANFYGPIQTGNVITQVNTNIYIETNLDTNGLASDVVLVLANTGGFGNYQLNEVVYQGPNLPDSSVTGVVSNWNPTSNVLTLASVAGIFVPNVSVTGANTGATYGVAQTSPDILSAQIVITADPPGANAQTAFGFDTVITETNS